MSDERFTRRAPTGRPATVDEESRTVEAVVSTGAAVRRIGRRPDGSFGPWLERLDVAGADLSRLAGAPLLIDHFSASAAQIGVVERAAVAGGSILAALRFSAGELGEAFFRDVRDGIRRQLSVGYAVQEWRREAGDGDEPGFTAIRWTPLEVSLVPIGADAGATFRSLPSSSTANGDRNVTTNPADHQAPNPASAAGEQQHDAGALARYAAEAARQARGRELMDLADELNKRGYPVAPRVLSQAIREQWSDAQLRTRAIDDAAEAQHHILPHLPGDGSGYMARAGRIEFGTDYAAPDFVRAGMVDALAHRLSRGVAQLREPARQFRGLELVEMARAWLDARGEIGRFARREEVLKRALHTTSDFPLLLADAGNKALLARFERLRPALTAVARRSEATNFHPLKRLRIGETPDLAKVNEHGEITFTTVGERKEEYSVATFARKFGISRQALINDELGAFEDYLAAMSTAAASKLGDVLWAVIENDGVTMSDGTPLFHANHGNKDASPAAISVTSVSLARKAMREQTGIDGARIDIAPRYLVVGPANETTAEQLLTTITAQKMEDVNPFQQRLELVVEGRITGGRWYLFSDPAVAPVIEYAELADTTGGGPRFEVRPSWDVLGIEARVYYDVGAGAVGYEGAYLNEGA